MSLHDAFLHDIKTNPGDDVPRLVYADWLEEQGDPARAEFIRLQCRLARTDLDDPLWTELKRQERAACTPHLAGWLGPLRPAAGRWIFRRGLLCVAFSAHALVTSAPALWAAPEWRWVEELVIRGLGSLGMTELASWPALGQVVALDLSGSQIGSAGARALAGSPHLAYLASLNLEGNRIDAAGAAALTTSAHLSRLTLLNLANNPLTQGARTALRKRFGDRVLL